MPGRPQHRARFEHEGHRIGDVLGFRGIARARLVETRRVGAVGELLEELLLELEELLDDELPPLVLPSLTVTLELPLL